MKRRELVQSLLKTDLVLSGTDTSQPAVRVASGAVRAMGLELSHLSERAQEAEELRARIDSGAVVVELDAQCVEPSFVCDRLSRSDDEQYRTLVESIRSTGQQIPVLVRPHPERAGHYQIAYGHRRREAALELGIPLRAIVRTLSDAELVVAQGKENAERRDLSFIERAVFAATLEQRGFARATANAALGVHTAEMTRLLSVAAAVPADIIQAIGPAPKAGRPRWMELARLLAVEGPLAHARTMVAQPSFRALGSDQRFQALIDALRAPRAVPVAAEFRAAGGEAVMRVERLGSQLRLFVDEQAAPGFIDHVIQALAEIVANYEGPSMSSERKIRLRGG